MQFSEAIKAIKERLSLADIARQYIDLKTNGPRLVAPCPFHQETKPSFYISPERDTFYCFGCQASGDLIEFYSRINGLDFRETIIQLAEEAGITIEANAAPANSYRPGRSEKQAMFELHKVAAEHFAANLARETGAECREYIKKRGIAKEIVESFGIGWASRDWHSLERRFRHSPDFDADIACAAGLLSASDSGNVYDRFRGRIMFPIKNLSNQVIAFGGRIIADEDEAKYINSADTPIYGKKEHLYGLAQARRAISAKGHALLTEGYMDVLTLHQFGFTNSVGVLGTALTEEQIKRLSGFTSKIGLLFDGDKPGRKAALRAAALLLARGLDCTVILQPDGEDIDSLLRGAGPAVFEDLLAKAPTGIAYCLDCMEEQAPRDALDWARNFIGSIRLPELISHYTTLVTQRLGLSENEFRASIDPHQTAAKQNAARQDFKDLCARDTQIMILATRYPEHLEELRDIGADLALTTQRARDFWALIERYGPDETPYHLDEKQKKFWHSQRGPEAAPRVSFTQEVSCLKESLERFHSQSQTAALKATFMKPGAKFSDDLEFLYALRDTMRKEDE